MQKRCKSRQKYLVGQRALAILTQAAKGDAKDSTRQKDNKQHPRSPLRPLSGRAESQIRIKTIHSFPRLLASSFLDGHLWRSRLVLSPSYALNTGIRGPSPSQTLTLLSMVCLVDRPNRCLSEWHPHVPLTSVFLPSKPADSIYQSHPLRNIFCPSNNSLRFYCGDLSSFLPRNSPPVVPLSHPLPAHSSSCFHLFVPRS